MTKLAILAVFAAVGTVLPGPAIADDAAAPVASPQIRYVDFPARIDPGGTHKHVPLIVGSRLYARPQIVVHQMLTDRQGRPFDDAYVVDVDSTITRTNGETRVVEPDGRTWHLSPSARIDRTMRSWRHVVVRPGETVPKYLAAQAPDIEVRSP